MPSLWNREVEDYKVDVFQSSTLNYDRSLRLTLKATSSLGAHTVSIQFPTSAPSDFINIGTNFSTIKIRQARYDEMYHILQTEKPVYFTAYEFGTTRFAGITTDPEATGEGFKDADANP